MALSALQMAQMSRLLDEALELEPQQRERWLDGLSPEYYGLLPQLRMALLPGTPGSQSSVDLDSLPRIGPAPADAGDSASGLKSGDQVGPYELIRPLGAGGMAEVWLARRADGAFKRDVALKLPMVSWLRRDLAQRFARERDILAGLEHVNIARLYDGGVSPDGLPYLAMEYVPGEPLTAWCDKQHLGIRQRLELFLKVLDAVQYAHARQVIHRDIKPSNILVTDSGEVRLLDFGVAKLLDQDEEGEHTQLTQLYGRALTPDYASPEYLLGDTVDALSDIYSLGVVLYELLTGNRPYRLKSGASTVMLERAIADAQIERPSTKLLPGAGDTRDMTQAGLARQLRGDLDAIVLKALAGVPARRYGSAGEMAEDIQRHLAGVPVQARPDSLSYRAGKFLLRHRFGAAATASFVSLLALGMVLGRSAVAPAAGGPPLAAVSEKSIAVLPFADMSEKRDQEYFSDGMTEELIDHLANVPELKVTARTSSFQFKGKNEDVRSVGARLGVAHVLEGSVRKSGKTLRITVQLIRVADATNMWSQTFDRTLDDVFKLQDQIAVSVVQSLKLSMHTGVTNPTDKLPNTRAYNLVLQGNYFQLRQSSKDAERAIDIYREAIKIQPDYAVAWARLARAYMSQATNGWVPQQKSVALARKAVSRALQIDPDLALAHFTLAGLQLNFDRDWSGAQRELDRVSALEPGFESLRSVRADLAWIQGRLDEAARGKTQVLDRDPLDTFALSDLALLQFDQQRFDEAIATSRKLILLNPAYSGAHSQLGLELLYRGDAESGLRAIQEESDESSRLEALAIAYWAMGRRPESDAALARIQEKYPTDMAYNLAQIHAYRGNRDAAIRWLERAFELRDPGLILTKSDLLMQGLRSDPRYAGIVRKLGFDATTAGARSPS